MNRVVDWADELPPSTLPTFAPPSRPSATSQQSRDRKGAGASQEIAWDCTATLESGRMAVPPPRRPGPSVEVVTAVGWTEWIQHRVAEIVAEIGW
jgi:hypothetical protein